MGYAFMYRNSGCSNCSAPAVAEWLFSGRNTFHIFVCRECAIKVATAFLWDSYNAPRAERENICHEQEIYECEKALRAATAEAQREADEENLRRLAEIPSDELVKTELARQEKARELFDKLRSDLFHKPRNGA